MGQPVRARRVARYSRRQEILGSVVGSCAGASIGLVCLLNALFSWLGLAQPGAFLLAFTLVAIPVFTVMTGRTSNGAGWRKFCFAVGYAALACMFVSIGYYGAGTTIGLVGLSLATSWYHSLWFTGAYVFGEKLGGVRAAVGATVLEGALGFTAFVIVRLLQG
jgi:hypothetical protein